MSGITLFFIASCLPGGRVRGDMVVAYGPECAGKTGWKSRRRTLSVWIENGEIRVHSHADVDWRVCRDWVLQKLGLPPWQPGRRNAPSPKPKPLPPLEKRNQFLGESLAIARDRGHITLAQLVLICNDLRNACPADELERRAIGYAIEFGFTKADAIEALRPAWRAYKAAERAKIFGISYATFRRLGLRRSGCVDVDPAERRRLSHQRHNAKRRARRAKTPSKRFAKIARNFLASSAVTTISREPSSKTVKVLSDIFLRESHEEVKIGSCSENYAREFGIRRLACDRKIDHRPANRLGHRKIVVDRPISATNRPPDPSANARPPPSRSVWCDPP